MPEGTRGDDVIVVSPETISGAFDTFVNGSASVTTTRAVPDDVATCERCDRPFTGGARWHDVDMANVEETESPRGTDTSRRSSVFVETEPPRRSALCDICVGYTVVCPTCQRRYWASDHAWGRGNCGLCVFCAQTRHSAIPLTMARPQEIVRLLSHQARNIKKLESTNMPGKIVTSPRTFGVEFELSNGASSVMLSRFTRLDLKGDGSISGPDTGEIVTPPLRGEYGERYITRLSKHFVSIGAEANRSCGTHAHIGAEDLRDDFKAMRQLMYLYARAEAVLLQLVPASRRCNDYCRLLKDELLHIEALPKLRTMDSLSRYWYKARSTMSADDRKRYHSDPSRYRTVNFHSVFYRGTVEVRLHGGTISAAKILHWIALHAGLVEHGRGLSLKAIKDATSPELTTSQVLSNLCDIAQVTPATRQFLQARLAYFTNHSND